MLGTMRRTYDMKDDFISEKETGMEEFQREVLESSFLKAPTFFCLFCFVMVKSILYTEAPTSITKRQKLAGHSMLKLFFSINPR